MTSRAVEFKSGGDTCKGVLTMPGTASGDVPLVIMAGGWCYTKEIVMPHYAKFFHDINCATLLFDYRCFGESSGTPRQHINPWNQVEDYRNALTFAAALPGIDHKKTGVWGISYSGGHAVILAALESRISFAISTIPVVDGFQTMRRCHGETRFARLNKLIVEDRIRRYKDGEPGYMPMSPEREGGEELTVWPFPHVFAGFKGIKANEAPLHEHRNTIESVDLLNQYIVKPYAQRIAELPIMVTLAHADNITSADLEVEMYNAIASPNKHFASVTGVDHMSLYTNRDHLAKVGNVQSAWLKKTLAQMV